MKTLALTLSLGLLLPIRALVADDQAVIVHEWGTFTCLQDEQGHAIGGINVDDEPVPGFVYQWGGVRGTSGQDVQGDFGLPPYYSGKGWMPGDRDVTMRLETPVLYFYPPKGRAPESVPPLQVHVDFQNGFLSQFYPFAEIHGSPNDFPRSIAKDQSMKDVSTSLDWKDVHLGSTAKPVETDDQVWTTPREVRASVVDVSAPGQWHGNTQDPPAPQAEHFLFYRGIGHLDSPLLIMRNDRDGINDRYLEFRQIINNRIVSETESTIPAGWVVEVKSDGTCAFRETGQLAVEMADVGIGTMGKVSAAFSSADFSSNNLASLEASMHEALVKSGLYPDEATAMLKTWSLSYFKSPGLRFFYLVPNVWVNDKLPLKITGAPTEITRVMVGRIELISDAQKAALARLAAGPAPDLAAIKQAARSAIVGGSFSNDDAKAFYNGEKPLSDLGITIPAPVQDYLGLGRFRDALVMHEQQQHPSAVLEQFIKDNGFAITPMDWHTTHASTAQGN